MIIKQSDIDDLITDLEAVATDVDAVIATEGVDANVAALAAAVNELLAVLIALAYRVPS